MTASWKPGQGFASSFTETSAEVWAAHVAEIEARRAAERDLPDELLERIAEQQAYLDRFDAPRA